MTAPDPVDRILDLIETRYVITDRTAGIRERIEARRAEGAYEGLAPEALAERITLELRECSADLHFKVVYKA